jgi:hypothetical protein
MFMTITTSFIFANFFFMPLLSIAGPVGKCCSFADAVDRLVTKAHALASCLLQLQLFIFSVLVDGEPFLLPCRMCGRQSKHSADGNP